MASADVAVCPHAEDFDWPSQDRVDPASLAEEPAMIECSDGRVELGSGAGYQPRESEPLGLELKDRFGLYEHNVLTMHKICAEGKNLPQPVQDPLPLWAGLRGPWTAYPARRLDLLLAPTYKRERK